MRPLASPCLVTWANFVEFHAAIRTPVRVCCDPALKYLNQLHLIIKEGGKGKKAKKKKEKHGRKSAGYRTCTQHRTLNLLVV